MSELARRWSEHCEIHLITWATQDSDTYAVPANVHRHGLDQLSDSTNPFQAAWANWRRVRCLRRTLQAVRPQMILSFSDQMNIVTLEAARRQPAPVVIAEHSDPTRQRLGLAWEAWRRRGYPSCSACVVLTPQIASSLAHLVPQAKLRVIPPAIEPSAEDTTELTEQGAGRSILFVGRLSREKRLDRLLDAWQRLEAHLPDWRLVLVGDGPERADLQRRADATRRVQFAGWCQTPDIYYRQADIFALTSDYEGFPVALLEAMNNGMACIATQCSSALEQLNASTTSVVVVPQDDPQALESELKRLATDAQWRIELSGQARQTAAKYHWTSIGQQWDQLLNEQLSATPVP